jgi:hypothetical protein
MSYMFFNCAFNMSWISFFDDLPLLAVSSLVSLLAAPKVEDFEESFFSNYWDFSFACWDLFFERANGKGL